MRHLVQRIDHRLGLAVGLILVVAVELNHQPGLAIGQLAQGLLGQPPRVLQFHEAVIQALQRRGLVLEYGGHRVGGRGDVVEAHDRQRGGPRNAHQL